MIKAEPDVEGASGSVPPTIPATPTLTENAIPPGTLIRGTVLTPRHDGRDHSPATYAAFQAADPNIAALVDLVRAFVIDAASPTPEPRSAPSPRGSPSARAQPASAPKERPQTEETQAMKKARVQILSL